MRIINSQDLFESYMSDLDEAMVEGPRQQRLAAKQWDPYVSGRDRANAFNIAVRDERPRNKKSTGGKGARYSDYGDRGAGNAARRRQGLPPLRGNTRNTINAEFELWVNSLINEGYDLSEYTWDDVYEIYETYSDYLTLQAFLIGEGYADSIQESDYMIENMDEDLIEELLDEGYKKLPVAKMMRQAVRRGARSNVVVAKIHPALRDDAIEELEKTNSDIKKMIRVASRHSLVKGKGRIRGEGQALLNRLRGEAKRGR